jgi:hypothetical protein
MSDSGSRIDVHINVNDGAVSTERLNRALGNVSASITALDLSESSDPAEPKEFSADGIITGRAVNTTEPDDIPMELYVVGRVVHVLTRDTPCLVQETRVDSSDPERTFRLYGNIKQ